MKKLAFAALLFGLGLIGYGAYITYSANQVYTITFNSNGGDNVEPQKVHSGERVIRPNDPTRDGYLFGNWSVNHKIYDFNSQVTSDLNLEAIWQEMKKYEVSFYYRDDVKKVTVKDGDKITEIPDYFLEAGQKIVWKLDGEAVDLTTLVVNKDIELHGELIALKAFKVTFDTNGGTLIPVQTVYEGDSVKKPDNPEKYGYVFSDWYLDDARYHFTESVTKNIKLVAKWEKDKNVKGYVVTFDTDGGTTINSVEVEDGAVVAKPKDPTKEGYIFGGWQSEKGIYNFKTKVHSNITLKAIWQEGYVVSFNSDGGTKIDSQNVKEGDVAIEPKTNPEKKGYIFVEWQLKGSKYDFSNKVTSNLELKALWMSGYQVKFDSQGGTNVPTQTIKSGDLATKPNDPKKEGYTFGGWQYNGDLFDFSIKIESDITLYAIWH